MLGRKVALGQDKERKLPFKIISAFCWSCPSGTFGSFVPREWQAAKGLLVEGFDFSLSGRFLWTTVSRVKASRRFKNCAFQFHNINIFA